MKGALIESLDELYKKLRAEGYFVDLKLKERQNILLLIIELRGEDTEQITKAIFGVRKVEGG